MDVEVSKENICINKLIANKKETIFVHNDIIVPDSKPDILNTINSSGNVCIYKKDVLDGKIKIDGNINVFIMYLPDSKNDNLRALNCDLEFSESIQIPNVKEGMQVCLQTKIKDIECKVLNGRKISVKAGIEFNIKVYSNDDIQIINTINNIPNIQTLQQTFNLDALIGSGKTSVYAKDTLNIDGKDELAEILKVDLNLTDKDIKISYNKILAKADLEVRIMYLTEDNRIGRVSGKIPVVGFIDMQNISENNICNINYEIKNLNLRANPSDEHSIYVEIEIEQEAVAYERKQVNLIEDLYSPTCNLEYTQKVINSLSEKQENTKDITIRENVKVQNVNEEGLIEVNVTPVLMNAQITNTKIMYSGELNLNFIFTNENTINSRIVKIPFEVSEENSAGTDKIDIETEIVIKNTNFKIKNSEEVECEADMSIFTKTSKNLSMNIINSIEIANNEVTDEDYDSLIIYIVRSGDTLWKIAKEFNSTIDEIVRMNGIEEPEKINVGQKLYIPKFKVVRKENRNNAGQKAINV